MNSHFIFFYVVDKFILKFSKIILYFLLAFLCNYFISIFFTKCHFKIIGFHKTIVLSKLYIHSYISLNFFMKSSTLREKLPTLGSRSSFKYLAILISLYSLILASNIFSISDFETNLKSISLISTTSLSVF